MTAARPLRAPQEDGAVLADPPLDQAGRLIAANRRRLDALPGGLLGRSWSELRVMGRVNALRMAHGYFDRAGEPLPSLWDRYGSIILAGHQPELFHPGVWVKNFALNDLARRFDAAPLNLVVDNDTVKSTALRVPAGPLREPGRLYLASVPFDDWQGEAPYEERPVRNEDTFRTFPARVAPITAGWPYRPLVADFWDEVLRQGARTPLLGERFAAARRTLERRWGCDNWELPVSLLCQTAGFAYFACHLLSELPRFHVVYNDAVRAYRQAHGIRSPRHPVPDLVQMGDWLEAPFWAWRQGQTRRGRLFVRTSAGGFDLHADEQRWPSLPPADDPDRLAASWGELEPDGFKVRSRALTTTLYARLFVGDLFIHGIGGGKYDELTDEIIRRFYGFEPPGFLVLSATKLLPLPRPAVDAEDCHRLAHELRDLRYNPQRHLAPAAEPRARALAEQKRAWIERTTTTKGERRERATNLRRLTESLRTFVTSTAEGIMEEKRECEDQLAARAVLSRRDYSFCLFPEDSFSDFFEQFSATL